MYCTYGSIAQLVEHRTENPCVGGSSPPRATIYAAVAQLVRAPGCGPGGRWFKSSQLYHIMGQKLAHYVPMVSIVGTLLV